MMKQPIHTKEYLLNIDMHYNLKIWAENKNIVTVEAIKTAETSYANDQTAVMYYILKHGK
jgi:hypothetical protein